MLATAAIYLDRQVLALTADKIIAEFHLTKEGFGRILASFRYSYGLVQIFGGFLVDAQGPGIVFPLASGLWSLSGLLTGFAGTIGLLTVSRVLLGVGEAFNWPCALKITSALLSPEDRPLANGIFNSGSAIGALLAPVIVTVITIYFSWRAAFVFTGAAGAVWVVVWVWYVRGDRDQLKGRPFPAKTMIAATLRIVSHRMFWALLVAAIIINGVSYYFADWVPLYLKLSHGFSFAVGNILSIFVYAGASIGNLLVGVLVRWLASRGFHTSSAKQVALVVSSCLMLSSAAAGVISYRYLVVVLLAMSSMGVAGFLVIYQTLIQDIEPGYIGISSGLLGGIGNLAYGYLSPYIGRLADLHKTFITLILVGVLPWVACLAILWGLRSGES
jgi:MFS transporter, ACS family, hexuronate transporter